MKVQITKFLSAVFAVLAVSVVAAAPALATGEHHQGGNNQLNEINLHHVDFDHEGKKECKDEHHQFDALWKKKFCKDRDDKKDDKDRKDRDEKKDKEDEPDNPRLSVVTECADKGKNNGKIILSIKNTNDENMNYDVFLDGENNQVASVDGVEEDETKSTTIEGVAAGEHKLRVEGGQDTHADKKVTVEECPKEDGQVLGDEDDKKKPAKKAAVKELPVTGGAFALQAFGATLSGAAAYAISRRFNS